MLNPAFDPVLLSRIEDAGINASAPPQQRWLDGWLLRFSPGKAKRARCIQAVAPGRLSVAAKLALARPVYRAAGLPLFVRITPFSEPPAVDATLAALGMPRIDDTRVMVAGDLDAAVRNVGGPDAELRIEPVGHAAFAQVVGRLRGSPLAQRQAHAERLEGAPVPFEGCVVRDGERQVLGCGQFALEGELAGLYDVYTVAAARGRGVATGLCAHLLALARDRGARVAYLQVDADNAAARSVYRRLGFSDAYAYHYRAEAVAAP